jgi:hypothetical protein
MPKGKNQQKSTKTTTSEAGHSLSLTSENCNYVVASMGQTPAQVPLEDLSDRTSRSRIPNIDFKYHSVQKSSQKAGKQTKTITNTLPELPDGESSKVSKKLRKKPLNGETSDKTSGNDVSTKKSTTTNKSLRKRAQKFKHQFRNNNININNMSVYQYKINYQYKQNYYMTLTLRPMTSESKMESQKDPDTAEINSVQPTSTSRLTSGLALRSTLRLTLTLSGNNNINVYQYNTIYMTLTLRPLTSETNMESHKDPNIADINCVKPFRSSNSRLTPGLALRLTLRTLTLRPMTLEKNREPHKDSDIAEINWVQPTSTLRLTSGLTLRSTLRLTLTLSGNNNINVYQYKTIYVTLTLRPMTSEYIADINCGKLVPSSTLRLTSGLALRLTLRLTMNSTFTHNVIWCKTSAPSFSKETTNLTGDKKSMIKNTVARTK